MRSPRPFRSSRRLPSLLASIVGCLVSASAFAATPVPENVSNGLDKIIESELLLKAGAPAAFDGFATRAAADYAKMALKDAATGRYVVDIVPNGRVPFAALRTGLEAKFASLEVKNVDQNYRGVGILEGYVSVADAASIARAEGVGSVALQLKPQLNAGPATSQGVNFHRVNQINKGYNAFSSKNITGAGISIGVMSDSFDTAPTTTDRAAADVAAGELPEVVVLEDLAFGTGTDEGRGMAQIIYDTAPGSKMAFATAFTGEVGFANNIRALAGLPGFTKPPAVQKGFKGDIVVDDVSYLTEPIFSDGVIAQAVNDVVAANVTYASSAANNIPTNGFADTFRPVPNGSGLKADTNAALAGTNIDLTDVDPKLYAGGFHNFKAGGLDVAQTVNSGASPLVFQWNDPFDVAPPAIIEPPILDSTGSSTGGSSTDFKPPPFVAGQAYVIRVTATPMGPLDNFDAIVEVIDPNGGTVVNQDTGTDEVVVFFAPVDGAYIVRVKAFSTPAPVGGVGVPTQGSYTIKINNASGKAGVTQDFNLLFFDADGTFVRAVATNNIANNRPIEIVSGLPAEQLQLLISRSNPVAPAQAADRFKYIFFGNGAPSLGPAEYFQYLAPVTFGHSAAAGANSVAAYPAFRPNIPEDFTSSGPVTIFFDKDGNRLTTPELRLKPDIAAADGVNTSFFPLGIAPFAGVPLVGDSETDPDDFPNFFGTSAAAPHAAAIAALILEANGGPGSATPAQVKAIFQSTAFPHDLDPYFVSGTADAPNGGRVSVSVASVNSTNAGIGSNDPNSWTVTYTGPGTLTKVTFNPEGKAETGGNPTGGNFNGFTPADFLDRSRYRFTPGMVFGGGFLFGDSVGLVREDVVQARRNPAPPPSTTQQYTLDLTFPNNNFTDGKLLHFNISRSQQQDATVPQGLTTTQFSADILGSGVFIPEDPNGNDVRPGMTFSGTVIDGAQTYEVRGRLTNKIGRGYSPLDGFGFINAEAAVAAPLPTITPDPIPGPIKLVNIAGRLQVGTNDNVGIGGFILQGTTPKRVLMRGIGPSLRGNSGGPLAGTLQDPVIDLYDSNGGVTTNDNWKTFQQTDIEQTGLAPSDDREAALLATLPPGNHTAILRGANNTTGVGLVEIYDLQADTSELGNLSVRADIQSGDNILIAGIIARAGDARDVLFRGIGPELQTRGVANALQDPTMELFDVNGTLLASNDNWRQAPNAAAIEATGIAPADDREPAIMLRLSPGNYTSLVRGVNGTTGIGLAEAYKLNQ